MQVNYSLNVMGWRWEGVSMGFFAWSPQSLGSPLDSKDFSVRPVYFCTTLWAMSVEFKCALL